MDLAQQDACSSSYRDEFSVEDYRHAENGPRIIPGSTVMSMEPTMCSSSSVGSTSSRCETPPQEHQQQQQQCNHARVQQYHQRQALMSGQSGSEQQQQQQEGVFIRGADRRTLQNLRVIRRTLVYAIGLSPNFAQVNTLKQPEYFGQYGEVAKLVINHHQGVAQDDPRYGSASAYVTFRRQEDAWAAICSVDGFRIMGRTIRASFGTTKYCNSFLRNLPCNNPDCLYLHELGDQEDRFTKDEVQLGLARHGSSFGFKEAVLGERGDADHGGESPTGTPGLRSGGQTLGGARKQPANPVFPPPCAMPPASFQQEGTCTRYQQRAGGGHHRHSNNVVGNGACGHAAPPLPPPSAHAYHSCGDDQENDGGGGGIGDSPGRTKAYPGADAKLHLPLDGPGGGGDDTPRPRRRRGQRGRRRAGNRVRCDLSSDNLDGLHGVSVGGGEGYGYPVGPDEYEERLVGPPSLECFFDARGGSGDSGGDGGGLSNSNGILYRPVPRLTQTFGCNDRSPGSASSSAHSNGGGGGSSRSPVTTPETLSNTPPSALLQQDATRTSFLGVGNRTTPPLAREVWNQTQYQHLPRPAPTFFGMEEAGARRETVSADQLQKQQQQLQQQLQQQQEELLQLRRQHYLYEGGASGVGGMVSRDVLAVSKTRQGLRLQHLQDEQQRFRQQQQLHGGHIDERASIVSLQLQVRELQRYLESKNGVASGSGTGPPASFLPPGLGLTDGSNGGGGGGGGLPGDSSSCSYRCPDDVSSVGDRLAALSWGNDSDNNTASGIKNVLACPQQQGDRRAEAEGSIYCLGAGRDGRDGADYNEAYWGATPSPFAGFGSLVPALAVSQAEASQWRRATPRLST